jgi:hypothetical protein
MPPLVRTTATRLALATLLSLNPLALNPWVGTTAARAELPPAVYAEEQRRAEVVAVLRVISTRRQQDTLRVQARIQTLKRQSNALHLHAGQTIQLRYALPTPHPQGWVGPSPIPVLKQGEEVTAWLNRETGSQGWFHPAAGGRSFGPSMEDLPQEQP